MLVFKFGDVTTDESVAVLGVTPTTPTLAEIRFAFRGNAGAWTSMTPDARGIQHGARIKPTAFFGPRRL